jgi:hypothetical protein
VSVYTDAVKRRKGVIFGRLSKARAASVQEAEEVLKASYPLFKEHHTDLASEWWNTRELNKVKRGKKKGRTKKSVAPQVRRRGRPRDVDRVVAGLSASALKAVTRAFGSSREFLEVQKAVKQLGGPGKVLALFKLFDR